ncbi:hypothetical protein D3C87_605240 [compost metagenome]
MVKHRTWGFEPKIGMTQQEIDAFDVFAVFKKKRHGMRAKWRFLRGDEAVQQGDKMLHHAKAHGADRDHDADRENMMMYLILNSGDFNHLSEVMTFGYQASEYPNRLFIRKA